ncbi:hypothetical protein QVD17_10678 [Tagetes erecta]|uniref:CTCHY-type domain-containing protein n=1 Tax=Tagetes erecta TaxID=13708 RepID=A0AAD8L6Z5_TARER|nr:hypothetical protein QVD17_10678 [Tagetes erecta]
MVKHETKSSKDQTYHYCKVCNELDGSNTKTTASSVLLSQEKLEAAIRRVNGDQTLEPQTKSIVIQNLLTRKATTMMMCMKCSIIQPIGPTCSTVSCNNLAMARYYCPICKLFDDERQIYHCPYCNLCRVRKGLGIDYFHCMKCNACMSMDLSVHTCVERCLEDNCPVCQEYMFTSTHPVKELACHDYKCPICSKSMGDMQVYFGMLDSMLAEEKIREEYLGTTQEIFCNDCETKGSAPFHWLYHKCTRCGSYNTRLI